MSCKPSFHTTLSLRSQAFRKEQHHSWAANLWAVITTWEGCSCQLPPLPCFFLWFWSAEFLQGWDEKWKLSFPAGAKLASFTAVSGLFTLFGFTCWGFLRAGEWGLLALHFPNLYFCLTLWKFHFFFILGKCRASWGFQIKKKLSIGELGHRSGTKFMCFFY